MMQWCHNNQKCHFEYFFTEDTHDLVFNRSLNFNPYDLNICSYQKKSYLKLKFVWWRWSGFTPLVSNWKCQWICICFIQNWLFKFFKKAHYFRHIEVLSRWCPYEDDREWIHASIHIFTSIPPTEAVRYTLLLMNFKIFWEEKVVPENLLNTHWHTDTLTQT